MISTLQFATNATDPILKEEPLMSKSKRSVASFSDLPKILELKEVNLKIPKLDPKMVEDPSRFEEVVEAKMKGAKQIQEGMSNALSWLDRMKEWIEQIEDRQERRIAKETAAANVADVKGYVEQCFTLDETTFKRTAAMAYLCYASARDFQDQAEADAFLADLEERGFLEENADGPVRIGYARYCVCKNYGFDDEDVREIEKAIDDFSRKLQQVVHQQRKQITEEIELQAENTLEELVGERVNGKLVGGKLGKCLLEDIPAESYIDRQGKQAWRGGGTLLVELVADSFGKKQFILPLKAVGAIERSVERAREIEVSLGHWTLDWERPPGSSRESFERFVENLMRKQDVTEAEAEEYVKKTQVFWYLIQRALEASKNKEEMDILKKEYVDRADITPEEIYGIDCEPQEGVAVLAFEGTFKNKNGQPSVYHLFGLFRQERGEDGEFLIEFVEGPEHVEEFLADCKGKKFPASDNFKRIPDPLGRVLRGIRGQVEMAARIEE